MDRVIQDSDVESDLMSPEKFAAGGQIGVTTSDCGLSRKSGSPFENYYDQFGVVQDNENMEHRSSQSLKRRRSDMPTPKSSQASKSKRHKSGEIYGSQAQEPNSVDFSSFLREGQTHLTCNLTPSTREDSIRSQPTMFSDATSTVPNNTMPQRQIEAELTLQPSDHSISIDDHTIRGRNVSSLPYSEEVTEDENRFTVDRHMQLEMQPDVSTEPWYDGADNAHKRDSYLAETQEMHEADDLEPASHESYVKEKPEEVGLGEPPAKQAEVPENQKKSKTKKPKKKLSSLIDSDDEDGLEKELESAPKASKKKKVGRPKRTKTSPATFGPSSTDLAVDLDTLRDIKQRFEKQSAKPADPIQVHADDPHRHNNKSRECENSAAVAQLQETDVKNVGLCEGIVRESLLEASANASITVPCDNNETQNLIKDSIIGELPKPTLLRFVKSNHADVDSNGKSTYRVGLSKRARIAPLLKSFRK